MAYRPLNRRRRHEDHVNHEAWAIPYADLLTLLLAFFVVMYAISSVNAGKYRAVSESLNAAFGGTPHQMQPIEVGDTPTQQSRDLPMNEVDRIFSTGMPSTKLLAVPPPRTAQSTARQVDPNGARRIQAPGPADPAATASGAAARPGTATNPFAVPVALRTALPPADSPDASVLQGGDNLSQVQAQVTAAMHDLIAQGQVRVHRYGDWLAVDISTDILFPSGVARLSAPAMRALAKLADALKAAPNPVRVEGHTDDRPIRTAAFPSNWELSAARAASVVHLFMDRGIAPTRMAVVGFGPYRPIASNGTAAGRNANRRVVVAILGHQAVQDSKSEPTL